MKFGQKKILKAVFGVKIERGTRRPRDFFPNTRPNNRWLVLFILLLIFSFFGVGRLVELQLIKGSYFRELAEGNRIRRIPVRAPRGEIVDRNNLPLARNIPVYKLAEFSTGGIVTKTEDISREEAINIQAEGGDLANRLIIDIAREYPLNDAGAHVVGYTNEANAEEVGKMPECSVEGLPTTDYGLQLTYGLGDLVGRMGIEAYYDCALRGINGEELIEVDAKGKLIRKLGRREPIAGKNLKLALDSALQQVAHRALLETLNEKGIATRRESGLPVRAGLIAQNPSTGEVLALASVPSFDPQTLSDNYQKLVNDINLPFFNRVTGGAYHPGSTFKLVTTIAAVESGIIDRNFEYKDEGFVELGGTTFRNWLFVKRGGREGIINVIRAIARSTDTFFYIVGEKVGITRLAEWAYAFNLGKKTGIDLPGEASGIVPTPEWKERVVGERWYLGNTYNVAIGQGDLTATPLQINAMTSAVATNRWCKPRLLQEAGISSFKFQVSNCKDMGISDEALQLVKEGMIGACSPGGTAGIFFNYAPKGEGVACKTGTAQFRGPSGQDETHAWFIAYASAEPQISVTALVEGGGEGSIVAAPIVKKVFEEWFSR